MRTINVHNIAACICILLCIGPILFIVGMTDFLLKSNDRKPRVDRYNNAVMIYNALMGNGQAMKSSSFSIDGLALTHLTVPLF